MALLRLQGVTVVGYIDDLYIQGDTEEECADNVDKTVSAFLQAGFLIKIHLVKSVFKPKQQLPILGFTLNSVDMTVQLATEQASNVKQAYTKLRTRDSCTTQEAARTTGLLVSSFLGVEMGPLFYRNFELDKAAALRDSYYSFDAVMPVSPEVKADLTHAESHISQGKPDTDMV